MLKRELKVLKYIRKHPEVTRKTLFYRFPYFPKDYNRLKVYLSAEKEVPIIVDGLETGETELTDESTYRLNYQGEQFFEDRSNKFWSFILPYGITTVIAAVSVILEILNFILGR